MLQPPYRLTEHWIIAALALQAADPAIATRTDHPPVIDGVPSESTWAAAVPLTDFTQRVPADGQPATERTELRILFDDDALYVAVWAFDSGEIVPGEAIRDFEIADADAITMVFDTFNDGQNGFVFGTTPAGIEYDGQVAAHRSTARADRADGLNDWRLRVGEAGRINKNWDGAWAVATSRDDRGWYAEFRIPFSTLRYGSQTDTWGFNVSRRVRRLNEESFWSPVPREHGLYRLDLAGQLVVEPPLRRSVTITPYVLGSVVRDAGQSADIGGEGKLQVTQGLTLDATINTDFAQVEVDDQQVNLTRFSLLFPEKRPFFLENAGFFAVGARGADLFHSRRIGIAGGQPVPLKGGGRLSGRAAGLNVGLLHIEADNGSYSVARVAKELPSRSRVGGFFANRGIESHDNRTYAVDGRVGVGDPLTLSSFVARTDTPGLDGADHAWDVTAEWSSRGFRGNATVREIGEHFNPEVGFVPRNGHRLYRAFGQWNYLTGRFLREIQPHLSYFTYRSMRTGVDRGFEESSRWHLDVAWVADSGAEVHTGANHVTEGLYAPFAIRGIDVVVPAGDYAGWESAIIFFTDPSRAISFDSRWNWGAFLSGSKRTSSADITVRRGASTTATVRVVYNDVSLPEGDFTTSLAALNLGYFVTPRIYLQSLIQYSDQIDTWSANVRFGWLDDAGTGLYVSYGEVQGFDELAGPLDRSLHVKLTRQFGG